MDDFQDFPREDFGDSANQPRLSGIQSIDLFLITIDDLSPLFKTLFCLLIILSSLVTISIIGSVMGVLVIFFCSCVSVIVTILSLYYSIAENIFSVFQGC